MENAEEIFHFLEEFSKRKPKTIPQELNEYLAHVARTGDPVYQWSLVKGLFKEKLLCVITDFYETTPGIEIPPYPNVDPFNYDIMKNSLLERLDSFTSAPFTVQRICELLTHPRKQYNRVDKFMRAVEKNILVVSTREPGTQRLPEPENGEPIVNGSDNNSEYNVDVEMEDMSWKENSVQHPNSEPQPGSSDAHISVDDIEARLKAKQNTPMDTQEREKTATEYESVTPPELNVTTDEQTSEIKPEEEPNLQPTTSTTGEENKIETVNASSVSVESKIDVEMKTESSSTLVIPEIKVDDVEMTEQKLSEQSANKDESENTHIEEKEPPSSGIKTVIEPLQGTIDESSSDSKDESDTKHISEVSTSSEESSSSSDNTDGNSNSPKAVEGHIDIQGESSQSNANVEEPLTKQPNLQQDSTPSDTGSENSQKIQSENYSITDVNSELPQPQQQTTTETPVKDIENSSEEIKTVLPSEEEKKNEEPKAESTEISSEHKET